MFIYLCIYFYIFLNSFLVFFEDHIGNKCAIVCFNVSILGKYYIDMYYNVLPNKLTHSHTKVRFYVNTSCYVNVSSY